MDDLVRTWCPECGPRVNVDEDGCCLMCGADASGPGAREAVLLLEENHRLLCQWQEATNDYHEEHWITELQELYISDLAGGMDQAVLKYQEANRDLTNAHDDVIDALTATAAIRIEMADMFEKGKDLLAVGERMADALALQGWTELVTRWAQVARAFQDHGARVFSETKEKEE